MKNLKKRIRNGETLFGCWLNLVQGGCVSIINGCVKIPEKPGLGVELDYDQLARGLERYEKCPYRKRDDEAQMRKHVAPDWKRILPRW